MRAWLAQKFMQATAVAGVIAGTESVIATVVAPPMQSPDGSILLEVAAVIATGAAGTGCTLRVRRGNGITGTQIGADITSPAATPAVTAIGGQVLDVPAVELAGQVYSLTCLGVGGTAAVTVSQCSISASVT